ncbi:MAG TPA: Rieske 2Fe-2S domain-containing protein [Chloroflexota bacterium]|nr:Rieske 2Fe-2S domain-containing protein [Chloroflexota bacterium]
MLTREENDLLTRVGPGTPMGDLLRRYWQPVCVAGELTADHPVKRVQVLGEELVAFRDSTGRYGLLGEHCSHRGTSLYYGFLEDGGLRCPYHGWLYDASGRCIEQPFEPAQSMMKHTIRHPAYPVETLGGLLFAYMGPPETKPLLPRWDVLVWEDGQRTIRLQETLECNWLQAQENSADVTHTYFLHAHTLKLRGLKGGDYFYRPFEQYGFQPFEFGLIKTWRYAADGRLSAEVGGGNPLIFPNILRQQSGAWHNMHWRVPIDDTRTNIIVVNFRRNVDGHREEQPEFPPVEFTPETLPNGEYAMDSFFGQDKMAWETQGRIVDRSAEHIGASDHGIALVRRMLLEQIKVVQQGGDPMGTIRDPERNRIVELPGWFVMDSQDILEGRSATGRELVSSDGVFDDRYVAYDVPVGAARVPRAGS